MDVGKTLGYKKVARSLRNLIYPILSRFALAGNVDGMMLGFPLANIYILLMIAKG